MIIKPFLRNFEIRTAISSLIGCEFESYVCIIILPYVEANFLPYCNDMYESLRWTPTVSIIDVKGSLFRKSDELLVGTN